MSNLSSASFRSRSFPIIWAGVPLLSLGFLAWAPFLYASVRTGRRKYARLTALYLALAIVLGVLIAVENHGHRTMQDVVGLMVILLGGAACVHTLAIRGEVTRELAGDHDPQLRAAEERLGQRERALKIAREDPHHAVQLGIGRPDLPGSFDGGLIDVNHAPARTLQQLPGIDGDRAARIVELRMNGTGFQSADDLDMIVDLDPGTLAELGLRAVFLPRY